MNRARNPYWIVFLFLLPTSYASGCGDDVGDARDSGRPPPSMHDAMDAQVDASPPEQGGKGGSTMPPLSGSGAREAMCEAAGRVFDEFVAAHQSCAVDEDCKIIGDCGPNADFVSVQTLVAAEARELQRARCAGAYDGPGYVAICRAGKCEQQEDRRFCCGCGDFDAGP